MRFAICTAMVSSVPHPAAQSSHLSKSFGLGVLLKTKSWEVYSRPEDLGLGKNTDAAHSIDLHLHIRVAIWVSQVCQMRPPSCILGVTFNNYGIFVQSIREG